MNKSLEICCFNFESALNAQQGGADRIELCENILEGGTTPSHGMISYARKMLQIDINVMIRPRGGDFIYSEEEFSIMKKDIRFAKESRVNGIVLGILTKKRRVDIIRTKELIKIAEPLTVTFHRAFDMTEDPCESLEAVIETGAKRLLTSGFQQSAFEGRELIKELVKRAAGRIILMPGAGINAENIGELAGFTGADEFHSSAKVLKRISGSGIIEEAYYIADIEKIREMKRVLG